MRNTEGSNPRQRVNDAPHTFLKWKEGWRAIANGKCGNEVTSESVGGVSRVDESDLMLKCFDSWCDAGRGGGGGGGSGGSSE